MTDGRTAAPHSSVVTGGHARRGCGSHVDREQVAVAVFTHAPRTMGDSAYLWNFC